MERKFMGVVTAVILVVSISISFLLIYVPNMHIIALQFEDSKLTGGRVSVMDMLLSNDYLEEEVTTETEDILKGHQIRLTLPQNVTSRSVSIENDYVTKTISITIEGIGKDYFDDYPMHGMSNNIVDVTYDSEDLIGVIEIELDDVLEVSMESEDQYIYFDFVDPHEIYDYVVVIDAGHGGHAPGATKNGVTEKEVNLDIVLELKKIFDRSGNKNIGVYYTRTDDTNPTFANRVGLANDSEADVFISVHNNSTASGRMSSISGTEVMYEGGDTTGESKELASICLNHLLDELGTKSKGSVVGDEVYIIRTSEVPVALVEVGFMTNQKELEDLQDPEYQAKAAQAIYDAIIEYLGVE